MPHVSMQRHRCYEIDMDLQCLGRCKFMYARLVMLAFSENSLTYCIMCTGNIIVFKRLTLL